METNVWESLHRPEPDLPRRIDGVELWQTQFSVMETRLYGQVYAPANLESALVLAKYLMTVDVGWPNHSWEWIWRGQADYRWRLDSGAVRRLRRVLRTAYWGEVEERISEYERELLSEARLGGYGSDRGRTLSDLELLALLQHHGGATRLLDFTSNLLTALWFACVEAPNTMGMVFGLAPTTRLSSTDVLSNTSPGDLACRDAGGVLVFESTPVHPRVQAQRSAFAFGSTVDEIWGSLPLPVHSERVQVIGVLPELKREMRRWGSALFGYSDKTMFPDVGGFGRHHAATQSLPARFLATIDAERRRKEGEVFRTFRPQIDMPNPGILLTDRLETPSSTREVQKADDVLALHGELQLVGGDPACMYWHLLNRAAGHPSLGVQADTRKSPRLEGFPDGMLGTLRQRQAYESLDGSERTLVSVEDSDDRVAEEGVRSERITESQRRLLAEIRSRAASFDRKRVREITEDEAQVLEESIRSRLYWLAQVQREPESG